WGEGIGSCAGYTRPGNPPDRLDAGGKIIYAVDDKDDKLGVGATIYFMVLDRADGAASDTWGTGWKDFDAAFRAGMESRHVRSPALDTAARYLYLYQVVNDRKTAKGIHAASVQLLVEPRCITSWGHFSGASFAAEFAGREGKPAAIRAVS